MLPWLVFSVGCFGGILGTPRARLSVPMAALQGTVAFVCLRGGRAALAREEQSPEPVPANTKHAFLSLRDKLVCQQQEVMLLPSSPRGNSSWFPWGCMQLESYTLIPTGSLTHLLSARALRSGYHGMSRVLPAHVGAEKWEFSPQTGVCALIFQSNKAAELGE